MSVQALGWVFDHERTTSGTDRLVLLALANHASREQVEGAWEAWPGIDLLAREAGIRRRQTVKDALGRLVASGVVSVVVQGAPDGRVRADRRTNLYRIHPEHGGTVAVLPSGGHGGTPCAPHGGTPAVTTGARLPCPEPNEEPTTTEPGAAAAAAPDAATVLVAEVWERADPKPATPYVAVVKIARKLVAAGWQPDQVRDAMLAVPTISTGWVEAELRKRHRKPPGQQVQTDRARPGGRLAL